MSFDNLGLDERLLKAVRAMGYSAPTPIQEQSIPAIVAGKDVVGCAQTGTGKTAAFTLPTLQRVRPGNRRPVALIVTPTRELALQIEGVAKQASRYTQHRVAVVYGGVGYGPQASALRKGVDILVATPGRLLDLCNQKDCRLDRVEVLVLDEADRMLDMGFWPDVRRIAEMLPPASTSRQTMLFSATMPAPILELARELQRNPATINLERKAAPAVGITQAVYPVPQDVKSSLLLELIKRGEMMTTEDVLEILAIDLIGIVPEDESIITSTNRGQPVALEERTAAGAAYGRIADRHAAEDVVSEVLARMHEHLGTVEDRAVRALVVAHAHGERPCRRLRIGDACRQRAALVKRELAGIACHRHERHARGGDRRGARLRGARGGRRPRGLPLRDGRRRVGGPHGRPRGARGGRHVRRGAAVRGRGRLMLRR